MNPDPLRFLASVDYETDKKIQDTIADEFEDQTILCIAREFLTSDIESERQSIYAYFLQTDCRLSLVMIGSVSWTLVVLPNSIPRRGCLRWKTGSSAACATVRKFLSKISKGPPSYGKHERSPPERFGLSDRLTSDR